MGISFWMISSSIFTLHQCYWTCWWDTKHWKIHTQQLQTKTQTQKNNRLHGPRMIQDWISSVAKAGEMQVKSVKLGVPMRMIPNVPEVRKGDGHKCYMRHILSTLVSFSIHTFLCSIPIHIYQSGESCYGATTCKYTPEPKLSPTTYPPTTMR